MESSSGFILYIEHMQGQTVTQLRNICKVSMGVIYPVWLGHLTHLLREAQSHWPPFCLHSQLCKHDTRAAYWKTRMPRNWDNYFKYLLELFYFYFYRTPYFSRGEILIVLELLNLKMEVTVSEPCDVIRVGVIEFPLNLSQAHTCNGLIDLFERQCRLMYRPTNVI